ncbi:MAG: ABC transporter permease, partial [Pyrinomonadaceae bacterium]
MKTLWQDLRYGVRMLLRNKGFTLIAVLTLALGIGANTAIFSLVNKLILRTLSVKSPEQLVLLSSESVSPHFINDVFSYPDYLDYRDQNQVFSGLIAFARTKFDLGIGDQIEEVNGEYVSGNYFDLLGVKAIRGRTFLPEENKTPGTHPVTVISYGLWQRRFGSDPQLVGKTINIKGAAFTVIGIAPNSFTGMIVENPMDIWVPFMMRPTLMPGDTFLTGRNIAWISLVGRPKPDLTLEQTRASMDVLATQIRHSYQPESDWHLPSNDRKMILE